MIDPGGLFEKAKEMVEEKLKIDVDPYLEKAGEVVDQLRDKVSETEDSSQPPPDDVNNAEVQ